MVAGRYYGKLDVLRESIPVAESVLLACLRPTILHSVRPSLRARMTDESATVCTGTRKKSYFQITKVVTATAEDEGDEDGDEDDIDGEEDELSEISDHEAASTPVNNITVLNPVAVLDLRSPGIPGQLQSSSTSSLNGHASIATPKFRLVRITKKTLNKQYLRGRWHCWDFSEPESAQQSPNDQDHETELKLNGNDARSSLAFPDSLRAGSRSKVDRPEDLLSPTGSDRSTPVVENSKHLQRSSYSRATPSTEEQSGRDRLTQVLNDVRNSILDFSKGEQREKDCLLGKNMMLTARMALLQTRERQLVTELDDLRTDFHRVLEENRRLVSAVSALREQQEASQSCPVG